LIPDKRCADQAQTHRHTIATVCSNAIAKHIEGLSMTDAQSDSGSNRTAPKPSRHRFDVAVGGRIVPAILWLPSTACTGLVVTCHGGGGHKEASSVLAIVERFVTAGCGVVSIDGPVHGERRTDGVLDPDIVRQEYRAAWRAGIAHLDMAEDFTAVLDEVMAAYLDTPVPIGYMGVSMGTAYGLPFIAQDPRISAAVIGLWSATHTASDHLVDFARKAKCAIWFTQQWNDELFDRAGTAQLFDALGSADKRLVAYPGPHKELEGERLDDAVAFMLKRLASQAG
jgi:alpha-beta hydrolase superfamily lysophospholipase